MSSRHRARERAVQILYLWDMRSQPVAEAVADYYGSLADEEKQPPAEPDPFTRELVSGVALKAAELDPLIRAQSDNWRLERMSAVDRNILRLAVYEMKYGGTPPPVAIDEAILLAERFSGDESVRFINGILDAIQERLNG